MTKTHLQSTTLLAPPLVNDIYVRFARSGWFLKNIYIVTNILDRENGKE
jgi:hypothetical protein